jgi:D-tyrosyl-tRNA(Tyr) deacylase
VVQRVTEAAVTTQAGYSEKIFHGCLVFIGVHQEDTPLDAEYIADKIANLRIFEDQTGKMNISLLEINGSAMIISQFTLYGDTRKGRRPSYTEAASGDFANQLYTLVCSKLVEKGINVKNGVFGEHMQIMLTNDGPVTLLLDSKRY